MTLVLASLTSVAQHVVDGLISGAAYGVMGLSFGLIVAVTQRFHFAWAISFAIAGYFAAYLMNHAGLAAGPAILVGLLCAVAFSVLLELLIYRPVASRAQANSLLAVFVASFGVTIAGVSLIPLLMRAGTGSEPLRWISFETLNIAGVTVTRLDVILVAALWACGVATWALLRFMPLGRQVEAVRVNPMMAKAVGIRIEQTYLIAFVIGSLLAGITAVFFAMQHAATASMGLTPVFYAFVVAFLAGIGRSPLWIMCVGTALGITEGVSAIFFSPQWQTVVVFAVLLLVLVAKAAHTWRPTLFRLPAVAGR